MKVWRREVGGLGEREAALRLGTVWEGEVGVGVRLRERKGFSQPGLEVVG